MLVRAARDGSAGPCGGTSGAEGLERQRLACILLRLNLALAVRISGPPRPVTLRSKVGKGLRGAGVWGGAPVYTSPAPDLQPEHAPPEKACGIRMQSFDPGRALERGAEGEFGIENADFVPDSDAGKHHRLRIG